MKRAASAALAALLGATLAAACGYPDFQFGTGGAGGSDATTSSTGGAASSSTGGGPPTVPCIASPNTVECAPNQVCCFDLVQTDDFCADPGLCGANHASFYCNSAADCPANLLCCFKDQSQPMMTDYAIGCQTTCLAMNERVVCTTDADCPGGLTCQSLIEGYIDYKICY